MAGAIKTLQEEVIPGLEGKAHEHANKEEVLDNITAQDLADVRSAVQTVSGVETTKTGTDVAVTGISVDLVEKTAPLPWYSTAVLLPPYSNPY